MIMIGGRCHLIICSILFAYQLAQSSFNALSYFANARFARMIFISKSFGPELNQSTKSFRASPSSSQTAQCRLLFQLPTNASSSHTTTPYRSQLFPEYLWPCSPGRMLKLTPNRLLLFPHLAARRLLGGRKASTSGCSIALATVVLMSSHDNVIGLRVLGITNRKVIIGQDSWQDVSHTSTHTVSLLTSS